MAPPGTPPAAPPQLSGGTPWPPARAQPWGALPAPAPWQWLPATWPALSCWGVGLCPGALRRLGAEGAQPRHPGARVRWGLAGAGVTRGPASCTAPAQQKGSRVRWRKNCRHDSVSCATAWAHDSAAQAPKVPKALRAPQRSPGAHHVGGEPAVEDERRPALLLDSSLGGALHLPVSVVHTFVM